MQPTSTSRKYDRRKDEELGRSKVGRVTSKSGGIRGGHLASKQSKRRKNKGEMDERYWYEPRGAVQLVRTSWQLDSTVSFDYW